jgi:hypothetical protein
MAEHSGDNLSTVEIFAWMKQVRIKATGDKISHGKVCGSIITRTEHVDQTVNKTAWGRPCSGPWKPGS